MASQLSFTDSLTGELLDPAQDGYNAISWTVNGVKMTLTLSDESYSRFRGDIEPWLDASDIEVTPAAASRAQSRANDEIEEKKRKAEEKLARDRVKAELAEAQRALEESIQPKIEVKAEEIPTLSAAEAKDKKRFNHGFTLCNEKLLYKIQKVGGPVKIRTNGPASKLYELQRKVAPLGIQLTLVNRFRVHENKSTEYYGDIYADLAE